MVGCDGAFCVAHGLDGPREADEIAELLVTAAGNDEQLANSIEAKLHEFGD